MGKRCIAVWLTAGTMAFGTAGCNPQDSKNLTEDTKKLAASSSEALGNAGLAGKVNGVLSVWKSVDMSNFKVQAQDGTVTLDGRVRTASEKKQILYVVKQIRGVDKVVDQLKVDTK